MAVDPKDVEHLRQVLYSGEAAASYEGKSVTYRSAKELRQLLASAEAELAGGPLNPAESLERRRTVVAADRDLGGSADSGRFTFDG